MTNIAEAIRYAERYGWTDDAINDAANTYAHSYEQYCILWDSLDAHRNAMCEEA